MKLLGLSAQHFQLLLDLIGDQATRFDLVELGVEDSLHRLTEVDGIAEVEGELGVESEVVRRIVG